MYVHNRGADPRARRMGAGLPADIRRAQSGQGPCSGARRRGEALDEVSAAIPGDAVAGNDQAHRRLWSAAEKPSGAAPCWAVFLYGWCLLHAPNTSLMLGHERFHGASHFSPASVIRALLLADWVIACIWSPKTDLKLLKFHSYPFLSRRLFSHATSK